MERLALSSVAGSVLEQNIARQAPVNVERDPRVGKRGWDRGEPPVAVKATWGAMNRAFTRHEAAIGVAAVVVNRWQHLTAGTCHWCERRTATLHTKKTELASAVSIATTVYVWKAFTLADCGVVGA